MAELKDLIVNGQSHLIGDTIYKTHDAGTSDTRLATTEFVMNAMSGAGAGDVIASGTLTNNTVILGGGNKTIKSISNGTNGQVLKIVNQVPTWGDVDSTQTISFALDTSKESTIEQLVYGIFNALGSYTTQGVYHIIANV